jgi:hypothetical protein
MATIASSGAEGRLGAKSYSGVAGIEVYVPQNGHLKPVNHS